MDDLVARDLFGPTRAEAERREARRAIAEMRRILTRTQIDELEQRRRRPQKRKRRAS